MTADRKPCAAAYCDRTLSQNDTAAFCYAHLGELRQQEQALAKELDTVLALEARFVEWCAENGQPHPHT